jgi:hypothetical protein
MEWAHTHIKGRISPGRRLHVMLTDRQYDLVAEEAARAGLAKGEVVRRCIDGTMRPHRRIRFRGLEITFTVAREIDAALAARRIRIGPGQRGSSRERLVDV